MLTLLWKALCALWNIPYWIIDLLVFSINGLILALGTLAQAAVELLPGFPTPPAAPQAGALAYANWFLPIGGLLVGLAAFVAAWITFSLVSIALRWVRAL